MVYITILVLKISVNLFWEAQIGLLATNKAFIKLISKYLNYVDIFILIFVIELSKDTSINKYIIILVESKQLFYRYIYSLKQGELKTLISYIRTT